jgi:uncharacterized protein (DUF1330 family)
MTAYLLIRLTVHDKEQFRRYAEAARGIAPRYGAVYLAHGRALEVLEGEGSPSVLTRWPSAQHIRDFWNSPDYQAAIELRRGAADVTAMIYEDLSELAEG